MKPDYILIPMIVFENENLRPTDKHVYGIIYWYERMKEGRCFAANETIAKVAGVDERTARVSMARLEKEGFIKRIYRDEGRTDREEIRCLVAFGRVSVDMPSKDIQPVLETLQDDRPETPRQYAKRFFDGDKQAVGEIGAELEAAGIPSTFIVNEMLKFKNHWTELTPNGKKQKWELERTFEVRRRIGTWFRNAAKWSQAARKSRAGAGVTV